jgi:hypothetical protein
MSRFKPQRPSPSMVVALIALFVALGGTGYAAITLPKNSVGSKQIKKGAVTGAKVGKNAIDGSKVKNDSLTGADINEGTLNLGKVPSTQNADHATNADNATNATNATNAGHAGSADSATNAGHATNADNASHADAAGNADTVGGMTVKKISYREDPGTATPKDILNLNGLVLTATCDSAPGNNLTLSATTTVAGAGIHAHPFASSSTYSTPNSDSFGDTFTDFEGGTTEIERDNWATGDPVDVADDPATSTDSMSGLITYVRPDGGVVTVNYYAEEDQGPAPSTDCVVGGTAIGG